MLTDGIPIIYEGQEQHYSGGPNPLDREAVWPSGFNTTSPLYAFITAINIFRTHVINNSANYLTYSAAIVYNDSSTIAMRKGFNGSQVVTVLTNTGSSSGSRELTLSQAETGFVPGQVMTDVIACTNTTVDSNGNLTVTMKDGLPNVFYSATNLTGTTICVNGTTVNPHPVSANPPATSTTPSTPTKKGGANVSSPGAGQAPFIALIISFAILLAT